MMVENTQKTQATVVMEVKKKRPLYEMTTIEEQKRDTDNCVIVRYREKIPSIFYWGALYAEFGIGNGRKGNSATTPKYVVASSARRIIRRYHFLDQSRAC